MTEPTVVSESAVVVVAPTVGRALHYYATHEEANSDNKPFDLRKPHAATVAYVYAPRDGEDFCRVNVGILDVCGNTYSRTHVPLVAPDAAPAEGGYVVWPPR